MLQSIHLNQKHFQDSSASRITVLNKVKQNQFSKLLPPLELIVIPGFGPVYVKVMLISMMISELRTSFSKGLDPKRIHPYDPNAVCYQNHPLGKHSHTVSPKNFPFQRKIRIADQFNNMLNSFSDAFKMYVEQKDNFYRTLNQETQECENDYFRIIAKDVIRNAWLDFQYQNKLEKALGSIVEALAKIKKAQKWRFKLPKRELILMKALLLAKSDRLAQARFELQRLPQTTLERPVIEEEKQWAIKTLCALGFEEKKAIDLENISGFDIMMLWSKALLKQLDISSQVTQAIVQEYLSSQPGFEHALYFLKYTKDNLALIDKYGLEKDLQSSKQLQKSFSERFYLTLEVLQMLHQDLTTMVVDIPNIDDLLSFYENAALAEASLKALELVQHPNHLKSLYKNVLPKLSAHEGFWIETTPSSKVSQMVVFIDTRKHAIETTQSQIQEITEKYPNLKIIGLIHPQKHLYQLGESQWDEKTILKLQNLILKMLKDHSENQILLCSYQQGERVILQLLESIPEYLHNKVRLKIFSSLIADQFQGIQADYFIEPKDRLALLAKEIFKNKLKNATILETALDLSKNDKTISYFYNLDFFDQYINSN